ncbi:DNA-binding transcriptional repressor PuuR [Enhygromyxa salina]|uniref:DNA-binding transcriptional repressor PuuR n=1 Tax=Enhygromyxa salina TaxID=215803 RepID=A0A2S9XHQ9_9BACT|nr:helix-turn-helix transcriptional regulator [Enhygromyxa salina]PRP92406.1 DNA-binding transcriptional repressor PuuR [Enhygromyxa salina]
MTEPKSTPPLDSQRAAFGKHIRQLRKARGMTQEQLAERSGLSADTIRRLEHGAFSPSLDTIRKLTGGLDLLVSTLFESFESFELQIDDASRELLGLLAGRAPGVLAFATNVIRTLLDELDAFDVSGTVHDV